MFKKFKIIILLCMLSFCFLSVNTVHAANTNKKSLTITINKKNPGYICSAYLIQKSNLKCDVKILSMSGKAANKKINWGIYSTDTGKGSLFYDMNLRKSLKKNKTLKSMSLSKSNTSLFRTAKIMFQLPEGMNSMKIKITISTDDEKKTIKSFKKHLGIL